MSPPCQKFGGHSYCGSGDIAFSLSRDLAITLPSHHPSKFGSHWHFGGRYIIFLVCHVILQDHAIKGSYDFLGPPHSNSRPWQVWWQWALC